MCRIALAALLLIVIAGCAPRTEVSDQDVTRNVERALGAMQGIDPARVNVVTEDGTVTLTGAVNSREDRDRVSEIVPLIKGVQDVNNELGVAATRPAQPGQPQTTQPQPDRQPSPREQDVRSALQRSNALSGLDINVRTEDGRVTLSGTAPNQASRELAERIAREQEGVTSVQNNIQVRQ